MDYYIKKSFSLSITASLCATATPQSSVLCDDYEAVDPEVGPESVLFLKDAEVVATTGKTPSVPALYEDDLPVPDAQTVPQHLRQLRGAFR
jgi:hypothetical protein